MWETPYIRFKPQKGQPFVVKFGDIDELVKLSAEVAIRGYYEATMGEVIELGKRTITTDIYMKIVRAKLDIKVIGTTFSAPGGMIIDVDVVDIKRAEKNIVEIGLATYLNALIWRVFFEVDSNNKEKFLKNVEEGDAAFIQKIHAENEEFLGHIVIEETEEIQFFKSSNANGSLCTSPSVEEAHVFLFGKQ